MKSSPPCLVIDFVIGGLGGADVEDIFFFPLFSLTVISSKSGDRISVLDRVVPADGTAVVNIIMTVLLMKWGCLVATVYAEIGKACSILTDQMSLNVTTEMWGYM